MKTMLQKDNTTDNEKGRCASLFDIKNVKDSFTTMFKQRDNNMRMFVIILTICFVLEMVALFGSGSVYYLFLQRQFQWDMPKISYYFVLWGYWSIFSTYVVLPFITQVLKMHDTSIGMIGVVGLIMHESIVAFASKDSSWLVYLAAVPALLSNALTVVTRSLITKCVGPFEIGKIFSILGAFQALEPFVTAPVYTNLYKATLEYFPGAFLLANVGLYIVLLMLFMGVYFGIKRQEKKKIAAAKDAKPDTNKDQEEKELSQLLTSEKNDVKMNNVYV